MQARRITTWYKGNAHKMTKSERPRVGQVTVIGIVIIVGKTSEIAWERGGKFNAGWKLVTG